MHADKSGQPGENSPYEKADTSSNRQQIPDCQKDDDANKGDRGILSRKVGGRAFTYTAGDFLHTRRALIGRKH